MWWPMLGGLVVGAGGLIEPRALGVGYDVIRDLLQGNLVGSAVVGLLLIKALIWTVSLGSGTSGGVLAPLLIMGGSLGALGSSFLPEAARPLWPMLGMAAILGGTMRSPLTGLVFAIELTHDVNALLPLLIACVAAHGFTVLVMSRSILTEKVARRGYHLTREYTVDPLEGVAIREVMQPGVVTVSASLLTSDLLARYFDARSPESHLGYPVVDAAGDLVGVVTRSDVLALPESPETTVADLVRRPPIVAYPDETCRTAAERMAGAGIGRLPVVRREDPNHLSGIVTLSDLLKARAQTIDDERRRERLLHPGSRRLSRKISA
jgi:CBS domain-containing protein